jgi:hypothetical protein
MNNTAAVDRLEKAILRRYGSPGNALRALGFDSALIGEISREKSMMHTNRRLARDVEPMPDDEMQAWLQLLGRLPSDVRQEYREEIEETVLRGEEPGVCEDRRRRRLGRDMPPPFAGRPTPGGVPTVGLPDPEAHDRRRRLGRDDETPEERREREEREGADDRRRGHDRRRRPAMDSTGLPTWESLWPNAPQRG